MFAHQIVELSGPDAVRWTEVAEPAADGGVVVDVVAAGVSFADVLRTRGEYQLKPPLPYTLGMDASGVVRSAPPDGGIDAGQRVAMLLTHGCWQDVVVAPVARVLPLPRDMSFEAGAAMPLNHLTALFALVSRGHVEVGETLVVHGAAGGVGIAALQVGRALGLRTIAVVGDESKREFALECGADDAVLADGWLATLQERIGERAVDVVLDPVGGDRFTDSLRSLAPHGRLLVVGFAGGDIPTVRVNRLLLGNTGVLGAASLEYFAQHPEVIADLWARLMSLWTAGELPDPPLQRFAFDDARGALEAIAARRATGKVILVKPTEPLPDQRDGRRGPSPAAS